ncbi:BTB/POZ domain-containing protein-like [Iris pallida]|uniref:BTB/POZ domain-containing protein-like n=1 Tax=Iris pallida TaxID=29817 RepID=A0AAX6ICJ1_IRIPA|nr:BTB/POZ domain-containing protein-like [Iris pallida]
MPPFATGAHPSAVSRRTKHPTGGAGDVVTLNVGGQIFQTTRQTLAAAGPASILSSPPPFLDRDPHLFSPLLSLLRSGRVPTPNPNPSFSIADLIQEAEFYGIDPSLLTATASHFDAFDLTRALALPLPGRDPVSAVHVSGTGSVHVAHGGKITSFDWSLSTKSTILTRFPAVDSLLTLTPSLVAAGAVDFSGLQILNLGSGSVKETLTWDGCPPGSGSAVQAIGASPDHLFGSFESTRRTASGIVGFDRATLRPSVELGRREIFGAELDSAIPATKLKWIGGSNLLLASGSHAGPSGLSGNVRLWDVRSASPVWEISEKVDCFADLAASDSLSAIFKIGVSSGEVFMCDLRRLSADQPWVGIGRGMVQGNGKGCLIGCHADKVFVSRGGDLEVWSEVVMGGGGVRVGEDGVGPNERVMRRNVLGRREDLSGRNGRKRIVRMGFGGRRMVVVRKDEEQCVEVWESSVGRN